VDYHPRKVDLAAIVLAHDSRTHRKGGRWKRRKLEISGQRGFGCVTGNVLLALVAALSLHAHLCVCVCVYVSLSIGSLVHVSRATGTAKVVFSLFHFSPMCPSSTCDVS